MKRYPSYKDSGIEWIGEIPADWDIRKLKHHFAFEKGEKAQLYTNEYVGANPGEYPVFSGQTEDEGVMGRINSYDYDAEDVLLATTVGAKAMTTRMISGRFSLSQNCALLVPRKSVNVRYCQYFIDRLFDYEKGMISLIMQPSLRFEDLVKYQILMPPREEQDRIADYLDSKTAQIDDLIAKKERMIELLKEERMAIINQAVTKGLDPKTEMKDPGIEWLGKIPKHWQIKRLKYVANINPQRPDGIPDETKVVFMAMESMNTDGTYDNSIVRSYLEVKSGFTYFAEGDVIFAKITPCFENGKGALLLNLGSDIGFGSTEFHVLRAIKNKTIPEYLYFLTISGSFRRHGEAFMQGVAGQKRVTSDFVQDFITGVPSVDEQKAIVSFLGSKIKKIDTQIDRENRSIEYLQEYRTSLISEVVTGKIDVRN